MGEHVGFWAERILPRLVDRALSTDEVNARRKLACQGLQGRVLEIGFGSGLNLRYYPTAVTEVLAVEPSDLAWQLAQPRIQGLAASGPAGRAEWRAARPGGQLGRHRAVDLHALHHSRCPGRAARDPAGAPAGRSAALRGARPGAGAVGATLAAPDPPLHSRLAGGCHLDRPIDRLIVDAGFTLTDLDREYGTGPKVSSYTYRGRAERP